MVPEKSVEQLASQIDDLLQEIHQLDLKDSERKKIMQLREAIEEFHEVGLWKMAKAIRQTEEGKKILYDAVEDPFVYALLFHHGIIKQDIFTRVVMTMEEVKPYLRSHGGDIELIDIKDNIVYVQLHGACSGCSLSAVTLKNAVEDVVKERVPEIQYVSMQEDQVTSGFMPVETKEVDLSNLKTTGWYHGPDLSEITEERPYFETIDETDVLFFLKDKTLMAFRNRCPHKGIPLEAEIITEKNGVPIVETNNGLEFDLTSGECLTIPHIQLEPFPVRIEDDKIWVRIE